jgi:hypothetical protein
MWRVNFGNGQVSYTAISFKKARTELLLQRQYAPGRYWIERYLDDGEWCVVDEKTGRMLAICL